MNKDLKLFCPKLENDLEIKCFQEILNQLTTEKRLSSIGITLIDASTVMRKSKSAIDTAFALESTLNILPQIGINSEIQSNGKSPEVRKLIKNITKTNSDSIKLMVFMKIEMLVFIIKDTLKQKDINEE